MAPWWLVSWTTYATWLPGDIRGYRTWRGREYIPPPKRYAKPDEPRYRAQDHLAVRQRAASIAEEPVHLTLGQMQTALAAMVHEIGEIPVVPAILSVGDWHVHWLCCFGRCEIRPVVARVKAAATRQLNAGGFQGKRPWTKGCNMRSKVTQQECRVAYQYVRRHRDQGCLIYEWRIDPNYLVFE